MIEVVKRSLSGIYVKDIIPYIIIGVVLYFVISRPISLYKARKYCKSKGLEKDLPKLKWYEWWL